MEDWGGSRTLDDHGQPRRSSSDLLADFDLSDVREKSRIQLGNLPDRLGHRLQAQLLPHADEVSQSLIERVASPKGPSCATRSRAASAWRFATAWVRP